MVRLSGDDNLGRTAVWEKCCEIALAANIPEHTMVLAGPADVGPRYTLNFNDTDRTTAQRRAYNFNEAQKDSDGKWTEQYITDPDGNNVRIYVGLDISNADKSEMFHIGQIFDVIKARYPNKKENLTFKKGQKKVLFGWRALVRTKYNDDTNKVEFIFKPEVASAFDPTFDANAIIQETEENIAQRARRP